MQEVKRARLVVTVEEAEQLSAYLADLRERRAKERGEPPPPRRALETQTLRFVPSLPPLTLRMWRTSFEQLNSVPSVRTAGVMLIEELERAYNHLERT